MLSRFKLFVSFPVLAAFFNISVSTAVSVFKEASEAVYVIAKDGLIWFSRSTVQARMPSSFKALYPNTRAIIDCSEIETQRPSKLKQRVQSYSSYKGRYTVKFLIGIAPSGEIMFVSPTYGGRVTDCHITVNSGFLDLLEDGDVILADKGFPTIEQDLNRKGGILVIPPFKIGNRQFSASQNEDGYKIASVRVHVERAIERIKRFEILNYVPIRMMPNIDKILVTCCFLSNLQPDLIRN